MTLRLTVPYSPAKSTRIPLGRPGFPTGVTRALQMCRTCTKSGLWMTFSAQLGNRYFTPFNENEALQSSQ
jgi:hypothetical protein